MKREVKKRFYWKDEMKVQYSEEWWLKFQEERKSGTSLKQRRREKDLNFKYGNIKIKENRGSRDIRKLERATRRGN